MNTPCEAIQHLWHWSGFWLFPASWLWRWLGNFTGNCTAFLNTTRFVRLCSSSHITSTWLVLNFKNWYLNIVVHALHNCQSSSTRHSSTAGPTCYSYVNLKNKTIRSDLFAILRSKNIKNKNVLPSVVTSFHAWWWALCGRGSRGSSHASSALHENEKWKLTDARWKKKSGRADPAYSIAATAPDIAKPLWVFTAASRNKDYSSPKDRVISLIQQDGILQRNNHDSWNMPMRKKQFVNG